MMSYTSSLIINIDEINSPLDQFDEMSWSLYNLTLENSVIYGYNLFEFEYDFFSLWLNNGTSISFFGSKSVFLFLPSVSTDSIFQR